jgi:mono/diheme cytochrome c family protein
MNRNSYVKIIVAVLLLGALVYFIRKPHHVAEAGVGAAFLPVSVPDLTSAEQAGELAFNTYCAACHGKNAAGQEGVAPPLVNPIYKPSHHSDQSFLLAAENGARAHHWPYGDMPPVKGVTPDELKDIVAYVRALQRANGID